MWRKVPLYQGNGAIAWASPEFQAQHPCFVIAPEFDEIIVDDTSTASNYLNATINLIKHLKTKFAFSTFQTAIWSANIHPPLRMG